MERFLVNELTGNFFPRVFPKLLLSVRCCLMRDLHWFEVTEKLRDSHPALIGSYDGLQSEESLGTVYRVRRVTGWSVE